MPKFHFEHITVDDGLAHSDAMDVVQDSSGFIWIATNNGMDRYDGYELKHYQLPHSNPAGVSPNRVQVLFVDLNGILWAGTEYAGVYFYDSVSDQFQRPITKGGFALKQEVLGRLNRSNVRSMSMDRRKRLWIATLSDGVFSLNLDQNTAVLSANIVDLGIPHTATSVFITETQQVWIGTIDNGLWTVGAGDKSSHGVYRAIKNNVVDQAHIYAIKQDGKGNIFVGSNSYLYRLTPSKSTGGYKVEKLAHKFDEIECVYPDSFGRLWIGTNFGLHLIENIEAYLKSPHSQTVYHYTPKESDPSGINSERIHHICEDSFGNLWLAASSGGVNRTRLQSAGFHTLARDVSAKTTLANKFVNAVFRDDANSQLWIGTRNGYSVLDETSGSYHSFLNIKSGQNQTGLEVSAFCLAGDQIWIGTRMGGLYRAGRSGRRQPVPLAAQAGHLPWNYINIESIVQDGKGRVWVGTFAGGISIFSKEGDYIKTFNRSNSVLPTNNISFLLPDPVNKVIWASTRDQGVLKLGEDGGTLRLLSQYKHVPGNENSLKVDFAWPLLLDQAGNVWVGTIGGGLHKIDVSAGKGKVLRYQHLIGDNDIESILADRQGNLWLAGAGLKKFTPQTGKVVYYDISDGLQSNSFKVGAAAKSTLGTMYFGGTNGVTWFEPDQIRPNPIPPLPRITGLRVLNKNSGDDQQRPGSSMVNRAFSQQDGVVIHADENDFLFEFVGLNFINPTKQSYAFMMEGYTDGWVQLPRGQRTASFANLPAGDYVFRVKADNGEGAWSVTPAVVGVKVLPAWWDTWWAYVVYALLGLTALFWYRKVATGRLKLENRLEIEKLKSDNERQIAEMKSTFFTSVSHEFRTPLTLILGPMEEFLNSISADQAMRGKVVMMHKQAGKLLGLVNQLLSFRKVESGAMQLYAFRQDVIAAVIEIFSIFKIKANELNIQYQIDVPARVVQAYFDPEKLEVIVSNLLSNAFKYSRPGGKIQLIVKITGSPDCEAVWIEESLADNYLEISVSDNGKGISQHDQEKIFDPYYQASNTVSAITGSGIGLALVKEFVRRHSGEILVSSELEVGSTFLVRLPFGKTHLCESEIASGSSAQKSFNDHSETTSEVLSPQKQKNRAGKILIVEDNTDLRIYLGSVFQQDYQVYLSADGSGGWRMANEIMPDLILSDVNMPEMSGLDLCKKIKDDLKTTHIPVILLTARAAVAQELEGLQTGADEYIVKPFHEDILKAKINTILGNRSRLREYYQRQILLQPSQIVIPDEDRDFLKTAMEIVEANLTESNFNVNSLVSAMHMSQSVFYRRIKSITGQSVIEFIKDIRLKRAAQLLASSQARISEVAFMVGVEDPKNFRVSFQKRFNMSPSQYAKVHRQGQQAAS